MMRLAGLGAVLSLLTLQAAVADEIRHTAFPGSLLGTWGLSADLCKANDKSNVAIAKTTYSDADGACNVQWIVETAGSRGPNYAVHASCSSSSNPSQTSVRNIIIRPESADRISIGPTFEALKIYQRCPAS